MITTFHSGTFDPRVAARYELGIALWELCLAWGLTWALFAVDWELQRTCDEWCREHRMGPCCDMGAP